MMLQQADSSKPPEACSSFDTTPLHISLPGKERQLTFEEAKSMPSQQYYSIYEVSAVQLALQLLSDSLFHLTQAAMTQAHA